MQFAGGGIDVLELEGEGLDGLLQFYGFDIETQVVVGRVIGIRPPLFGLLAEDNGPLILSGYSEQPVLAGGYFVPLESDVVAKCYYGSRIGTGTPYLIVGLDVTEDLSVFYVRSRIVQGDRSQAESLGHGLAGAGLGGDLRIGGGRDA